MIRTVRYLLLAFWAVQPWANIAAGAETATGTEESQSLLVGDLGRREALVLEGNKTFTREQILRGLTWHMEFHIASHRLAPLTEYRSVLQHQLVAGYRRAGFPDVTVEITAAPKEHKLIVRVNEGPRFACGDLVLSGVKNMTNDTVRQKIVDALMGFEPGLPAGASLDSTLWRPDKPAPLDESARNHLTACVQEALAKLGYFQPQLSLRLMPDRTRQLADLKVEISNEGIKGTIEEIDVTGLLINTRAQVLEFLNLKPGLAIQENVVATISNRLWQSARFFRQDVTLVPLPQVGRHRLTLDLDEVREAPTLQQELSDKEKALLRFREWLTGWEKRPEDFVISLGMTNSLLRYHAEITLSPSGFALAVHDDSNRPPKLHYAVVASDKLAGFYSVWRRSKFTMQRTSRSAQVSLRLQPPSPRSYGNGAVQLAMILGVPSSQPPFHLNLDLEPAVFLSMAYENSTAFKDGVLTVSNTWDDVFQEIRVDAATGRLLQFTQHSRETNAVVARLHSEEGAFARLLKEIAGATAAHPNHYTKDSGFVSWLTYIAADLVESPLLDHALVGLGDDLSAKEGSPGADTTSRQLKTMLALARAVLPQRSLERFFAPLNRLSSAEAEDAEEDGFTIPADASMTGAAGSLMAMIGALVLSSADDLFLRDSWPWLLFRETAFKLSGHGRYAQTELEQLLKSNELGPIGCLVTAHVLGKTDPRLARTFAERGLARLTPAEFRKDYATLMETNSIVGALAGNALAALGDLATEQLTAFGAMLAPDETALIQQLTERVRAINQGPPNGAAWPALEQYWNQTLRRQVETMLGRFLPQVQFLTNSQALYERGLALVSDERAFQDFDEAAQCFRKAADLGHAGAQLQLGLLSQFGKGMPEDFAGAMRWFREAAKHDEPHAACSIAGLYRDGKGVRQDVDEALKWYRLDAQKDCLIAQLNLGAILEMQLHTEEALTWYRRAAEAGATLAHAKLGNLLSDGFSTTPDYVEACQWLMLAADGGDKLSQLRLRRIKAKLAIEQFKEAVKRAAAVTHRLEEREKKTEQARRNNAGTR